MVQLRRLVGLSILVLLALGSPVAARTALPRAAGSTAKAGQDSGKIVADSGFRPDKDGFLFENYGANVPVTNLTAADLRRMFGDQVCARLDGDKCDLTPPAQQFMDQVNAAMSGGHCEGMAVLSSLFYSGGAKTDDFGGNNIGGLTLPDHEKLQREIAYWFTTQATQPARGTVLRDITPKEVVDQLVKTFNDKSETYAVGIYKADRKGGHAITPYAVTDMGNGIMRIMVYDNNWPKQERYIEVDTNANTWTYVAATNPNEPEAVYKGDAETKTLELAPISSRTVKQNCNFCEGGGSSYRVGGLAAPAIQYNEITLYSASQENQADLLITDAEGHRLGYQGGKFYSEIPNADFDPLKSADLFKDNPEPIYRIPTGVAFSITLDGSAITKDEIANVSMLGPGYDLAIENIKVSAGEKDVINFSPDGTKITYTPSSDESPDFIVGFQAAGPDYEFTFKGADVQPGANIEVTLDKTKGRLGIHTSGNGEKTSTYALEVDRTDSASHVVFTHDGLTLEPNDTAYIEYGAWNGSGDMTISLDKGSDGSVDSTQSEGNQQK